MVRTSWKEWCEVDAVDTEGFEVIEMLLDPFEVAAEKLNPSSRISPTRRIVPITRVGPIWELSLDI